MDIDATKFSDDTLSKGTLGSSNYSITNSPSQDTFKIIITDFEDLISFLTI
jgi:hypothetical protein